MRDMALHNTLSQHIAMQPTRHTEDNTDRISLSVIVVASNVEQYIEQALSSVASQLSTDCELIYVDNGSNDETLNLAGRVKRLHPNTNFHIIVNRTNTGLGQGRNQALTHCKGRYVMFLDGDDWLDTSALQLILRSLASADVDLLFYNHARVYADGHIRNNTHSQLLQMRVADTTHLRLALLHNLNVAWNKVYSLSFIKRHSLQFGQGFYEDIAWNFKALLLAQHIRTIPNCLVYYRQRFGSILNSCDERHFDVFGEWQAVISFLENNQALACSYAAEIRKYAISQLETVLQHKFRVPHNMRRAFFTRMSECFGRLSHLAQITAPERPRYSCILHDSYYYYLLIRFYLALRRTAVGRFAGWTIQTIKSPSTALCRSFNNKRISSWLHNNVFLRLPMDHKLIVFESYWGRSMSCNPHAIYCAASQYPDFKCSWVLMPNSPRRDDAKFTCLTPHSIKYAWHLARAGYLVSNANFPTEYNKRRGSIHLQTKHGTPLKFMGLDIRKTRPKEMHWKDFAKRCQRWDYVLSSNSYSSRTWRQGFPYSYQVLETGYPRNDIFYKNNTDLVESLRASLGIPARKKVALYAPTFRDWNNQLGKAPDCIVDVTSLSEALGPDFTVLVRSHYLNVSYFSSMSHSNTIIDVTDYPEANELCLLADLLITDYSSLIFDYANLRRPIVLYIADYHTYTQERGMYFDIRSLPPGPVADTLPQLLEICRDRTWSSADHQRNLQAFAGVFCEFDDGKASERVLSRVFGVTQQSAPQQR